MIDQTPNLGIALIDENTNQTVKEWALKLNGQDPNSMANILDQAVKALQDAMSNIPKTMPNPFKLNFTGAVTGSYDGSEEISIPIPDAGATDATGVTATVPAGLPPETEGNVQAILDALDKKPTATPAYPVSPETAPTKELTPNTFYIWGEMPALTVSLGAELPNVVNEYVFQFSSGSSPTTLSVPDTVKWVSGNTIEANKTYQVSIINGIGVIGGA